MSAFRAGFLSKMAMRQLHGFSPSSFRSVFRANSSISSNSSNSLQQSRLQSVPVRGLSVSLWSTQFNTPRTSHSNTHSKTQSTTTYFAVSRNMSTLTSGTSAKFHQHRKIVAVIGVQWGDEGKGKLVDILAPTADIVARFNGGSNAGHSIQFDEHRVAVHLLPSGILHSHVVNVLGPGVAVNPLKIKTEMANILAKIPNKVFGELMISDTAPLCTQLHILGDRLQEWKRKNATGTNIGTTGQGIGPCYVDVVSRDGPTMYDFAKNFGQVKSWAVARYAELLKQYPESTELLEFRLDDYLQELYDMVPRLTVTDTTKLLNGALRSGKKVLVEGANSTTLDVRFGVRPNVTASSTLPNNIYGGLGINPHFRLNIIGVAKGVYSTRVGNGPCPGEFEDAEAVMIRDKGQERGVTSGRPRRIGYLDLPLMQWSAEQGINMLNLTKMDMAQHMSVINVITHYVLDGKILPPGSWPKGDEWNRLQYVVKQFPAWKENLSKCQSFEEFPWAARNLVHFIEQETKLPAVFIGTSPDRQGMVTPHQNKPLVDRLFQPYDLE